MKIVLLTAIIAPLFTQTAHAYEKAFDECSAEVVQKIASYDSTQTNKELVMLYKEVSKYGKPDSKISGEEVLEKVKAFDEKYGTYVYHGQFYPTLAGENCLINGEPISVDSSSSDKMNAIASLIMQTVVLAEANIVLAEFETLIQADLKKQEIDRKVADYKRQLELEASGMQSSSKLDAKTNPAADSEITVEKPKGRS